MKNPTVFTVLVNWQNWRDTLVAVASLEGQTHPTQIVVVDNGSPNDSEANLRQALGKRATLVQSGSNLGWAGGSNIGIRHALERGADYIWLFNNDALADPTALQSLVDCAESHPGAAACGSLIYIRDAPEIVWFAGGGIDLWRGITWHRGRGAVDRGQFAGVRSVDYVTGCSLLIPRWALETIGLLPENYFLYYEDADWCLAARRAGYETLLVPTSKAWHQEGSSAREADGLSPTHAYYDTRSNLYFIERHCHRFQRLTAFCWFALRKLGKAAYWQLGRKREAELLLKPSFQAVEDYLGRRTGPRG